MGSENEGGIDSTCHARGKGGCDVFGASIHLQCCAAGPSTRQVHVTQSVSKQDGFGYSAPSCNALRFPYTYPSTPSCSVFHMPFMRANQKGQECRERRRGVWFDVFPRDEPAFPVPLILPRRRLSIFRENPHRPSVCQSHNVNTVKTIRLGDFDHAELEQLNSTVQLD